MEANWVFVLTVTGLGFGTLVSVHFLTIKRPGISTKMLGLYTLALTLSLLEFIMAKDSWVSLALGSITLLYGPLLFLYVKSRIDEASALPLRDYRHFALFISYSTFMVVMSVIDPAKTNVRFPDWVDLIVYEGLFVQIFFYCIKTWRYVTRHGNLLREEDALVKKMKITFLYGLTLCSACLFLGSFLSTHFFLLSGINIPMEFKISIQVALCVILFFIALVNTETMYGKKLIRAM